MSDLFPKWWNQLPLKVIGGLIFSGVLTTGSVWYYFTPKYTRVGYQPIQPIPYSHFTHVQQLGLDCRYCHTQVDKSALAGVPSASICMNCHSQVLATDARLEQVRESAKTGKPIAWVRIHRLPDYVFFNHAAHVNRGVGCISCHGNINQMVEVKHSQPMSMSFCLDCHRNPAPNLRPLDQIYNMNWNIDPKLQLSIGEKIMKDWNINASQNCSACHR